MENPIGLDGFEFVEYASHDPQALSTLFLSLGFHKKAMHKSKPISLYKQGDIHFVLNDDPNSHAKRFSFQHGPCASSMCFRVDNAKVAFEKLLERGAEPYTKDNKSFDLPAIIGIGGSLIYLNDEYGAQGQLYRNDFEWDSNPDPKNAGLTVIDHLTHNVFQGCMDKWAAFYERLFNFREIRYFDIKGKKTGLISRALASPCGKIRIPLNESLDDKSQIAEYLNEYKGEGIQHIALSSDNIYESVEDISQANVRFLDTPDTYYEMLEKRLPGHGEDTRRMQKNRILIDGETDTPEKPLLLQIFTQNMIGPIFFDLIQRKGHQGFGEGNFQALFEAIELDQMRRGVL